MAFKIYFNKKTRHPSISLSGKEKEIWENMEMTHHPTSNHPYIEIVTFSNNGKSKSFVRRYVRKDKRGVKGKRLHRVSIESSSENEVKSYLKTRNKKR